MTKQFWKWIVVVDAQDLHAFNVTELYTYK